MTVTTEPTPPRTPGAETDIDAEQIATLGYEEARDELIEVVATLESGGATLEESLRLWSRGEALAARCQEWLDGARERLTAASEAAASGSDESKEEAS